MFVSWYFRSDTLLRFGEYQLLGWIHKMSYDNLAIILKVGGALSTKGSPKMS
jgi:hypothetical protein